MKERENMKEKKNTFKEMCEYISDSKLYTKDNGENMTAEDIWNYSPNGELFHIFRWYKTCKMSEELNGLADGSLVLTAKMFEDSVKKLNKIIEEKKGK